MAELFDRTRAGKSRDFPPKLDAANWEIRLLLLAPAALDTDPLTGTFEVVSLHEHARYDAISHAWGMSGPLDLIEIDQHRHYITLSLSRCLKALRHRSQKRALWDDAICVDQKSIHERAQQIQFMQHTFSQANRVEVWLGYNSTRCSRLVGAIQSSTGLPLTVSKEKEQQISDELDSLHTLLYELEYWDRLWIWQELALVRNIRLHHGSASMSMESFRGYLQKRTGQQYNSVPMIDRSVMYATRVMRLKQIDHLRRLLSDLPGLSRAKKMRELLLLFARARHTRVSNSRDRVYGLLGICTAMFGADFMAVDYAQSTAEIYTSFVIRTIRLSQSLVIFNQAVPAFKSINGLPSWIPDWSSSYDCYDEYRRMVQSQSHNACGKGLSKLKNPILIRDRGDKLNFTLTGLIHGTVDEVGIMCPSRERHSSEDSDTISVLHAWYGLAHPKPAELTKFLRSCSHDAPIFALTMCRGAYNESGKGHAVGWCEALTAFLLGERAESTTRSDEYDELRDGVAASRLFTTGESSRIGLGPVDTLPGDQIAVLGGGKVPYILRKVNGDGLEVYTLVGEFYVHGIMQGEAIDNVRGEIQEITLV